MLHSIISHAPLLTYGLEKAISPDMLTECRSLTVRLLSKMFERNSRSTCAAKGWKDSTVLGSLGHHRFVGSRSHAPSLFFQTRSNTCGIRGTLIRPVEECTNWHPNRGSEARVKRKRNQPTYHLMIKNCDSIEFKTQYCQKLRAQPMFLQLLREQHVLSPHDIEWNRRHTRDIKCLPLRIHFERTRRFRIY